MSRFAGGNVVRLLWVVAYVAFSCSVALARSPEFKSLSVAELEQMAPVLHKASDATAANTLSASHMSERLTPARLEALLSQMPGRHAREQLLAIAGEAEFQPLPPVDLVQREAPPVIEQRAMLVRIVDYVQNTMRNWPRFNATRTALRFEGTAEPIPGGLQDELAAPLGRAWVRSPDAANWECPGRPKQSRRRMGVIERTTAPVLVREGARQVHSMDSGAGEFACAAKTATANEFGEVLMLPLLLPHATVEWSHWERGVQGPVAALHFSTMVQKSRGGMAPPLPIKIEGEIVFQPETGAIERLSALRKWRDDSIEKNYWSMVEFGPVVFNGSTWFFPRRRVALYRTPFLRPRREGGHVEKTYRHYNLTQSPLLEYLVDVRFSEFSP